VYKVDKKSIVHHKYLLAGGMMGSSGMLDCQLRRSKSLPGQKDALRFYPTLSVQCTLYTLGEKTRPLGKDHPQSYAEAKKSEGANYTVYLLCAIRISSRDWNSFAPFFLVYWMKECGILMVI